jgi:hypothetical protein
LSRDVSDAQHALGKGIGQVTQHQQAMPPMSQQSARVPNAGAAAGYFTEIAIFRTRSGPQKLPVSTSTSGCERMGTWLLATSVTLAAFRESVQQGSRYGM